MSERSMQLSKLLGRIRAGREPYRPTPDEAVALLRSWTTSHVELPWHKLIVAGTTVLLDTAERVRALERES